MTAGSVAHLPRHSRRPLALRMHTDVDHCEMSRPTRRSPITPPDKRGCRSSRTAGSLPSERLSRARDLPMSSHADPPPQGGGAYALAAPAMVVYGTFLLMPLGAVAVLSLQGVDFNRGILERWDLANYAGWWGTRRSARRWRGASAWRR